MIGNGSLHRRKLRPCPLVGNFLLLGRDDYRIRAWEYGRLIAVASHRTRYGGSPSGERTAVMNPRRSGCPILALLITSQSPILAFIRNSFFRHP
jgi:hypothetical protein